MSGASSHSWNAPSTAPATIFWLLQHKEDSITLGTKSEHDIAFSLRRSDSAHFGDFTLKDTTTCCVLSMSQNVRKYRPCHNNSHSNLTKYWPCRAEWISCLICEFIGLLVYLNIAFLNCYFIELVFTELTPLSCNFKQMPLDWILMKWSCAHEMKMETTALDFLSSTL